MRSQRQLKVGEEIRHVLAQLVQRGDVPWPAGVETPLLTVTEVQVSPDLRNASAYFTVMQGDAKLVRKILMNLAGFFRREVGHAVKLRFVPKLDFRVDSSFEYASNIERLLSKPEVARDLAALATVEAAAPPDGEQEP